jgi:hypothetical protein
MIPDVCALVRADHDDQDRALAAMVDPRTAVDELSTLLDVLKLAFAVHVSAEAKVFDALLDVVHGPEVLTLIVVHAREEHAAHQRKLDALSLARPGSDVWYGQALELRIGLLDHASRAELARWTLQDHVPVVLRRALASDYATERMRMLARTSPVALARARLETQPADYRV